MLGWLLRRPTARYRSASPTIGSSLARSSRRRRFRGRNLLRSSIGAEVRRPAGARCCRGVSQRSRVSPNAQVICYSSAPARGDRVRLIPGGEPELGECRVEMALDRPHGKRESVGDPCVAGSLGARSATSRCRRLRGSTSSGRRPAAVALLRTGPPFRELSWRPWWIEPAVLHVDRSPKPQPTALMP